MGNPPCEDVSPGKNVGFSIAMLVYQRVLVSGSVVEILLMAEILHQLIGSLSHYLRCFIHPRWCMISSINSTTLLKFDSSPPENLQRDSKKAEPNTVVFHSPLMAFRGKLFKLRGE